MTKYVFISCFLLYTAGIVAQSRAERAAAAVEQAEVLKQKFEKEDIVALSKNIHISFDRNRREGFVEVTKTMEEKLINTASTANLQYPLFYNAESEILKFKVYDTNGSLETLSIKDEYLNNRDLFHSDYRVQYVNLNFPLKGETFTLKTEQEFRDVKYFTSEYFTQDFPVIEGTISVEIPSWLTVEIKEFNFDGFTIEKREETIEDGKIVHYTFKELEAQSSEPSAPGPSYMYPHILFLAKSYINKSGETKQLFNSVEDLYGWYSSLVEEVVIDPSVFAEKVRELTASATSEEEKIKNIYYWVQDNIRYVAFEDGIAGFQPDSPQNVYNKRYGDCKGMAILTKSMLQEAGFDARLVWIGTDRLAYDYTTPSLSVDNHMICSVIVDGETIFLDGTEKYNKYGDYASRIQNKQALIENEKDFTILTVPAAAANANTDITTYTVRLEDETLTGHASRSYSDECRVSFQNNYSSFGKTDQQEILENYLTGGNSNTKISTILPFEVEERDKDLKIEYDVAIKNAVSEFDGTIYLDIDPVKVASDWLIKDRKTDYKSSFKQRKITKITFQIPEGYEVDLVPQNLSVQNELISIEVTYEVLEGNLQYKKDIHFKNQRIRTAEFDEWNKAFNALKENLNQQITLVKK